MKYFEREDSTSQVGRVVIHVRHGYCEVKATSKWMGTIDETDVHEQNTNDSVLSTAGQSRLSDKRLRLDLLFAFSREYPLPIESGLNEPELDDRPNAVISGVRGGPKISY